MKVSVKLFPGKTKKLTDAQWKAAGMTAEQMLHEIVSDAVIPFDEGTLQNVQTFVDTRELKQGHVSIAHDTPYAARLYYHPEYNFQTTTNANARGQWWEDWLEGAKKSRPAKIYKTFYKKLTGGIVK